MMEQGLNDMPLKTYYKFCKEYKIQKRESRKLLIAIMNSNISIKLDLDALTADTKAIIADALLNN